MHQPLVGGCECDKKNWIELVLNQCLSPWLSFFRNQIDDENCIDSGLFSLVCQPIFTELQHWVEIAEQYDWYIDLPLCMRNAFKRVAERNAIPQRTFRCALNDLSVGDRIAERDAKLDYVSAGRREFDEQQLAGCKIGIASRHEGDEPAASGAFQLPERLPDPTPWEC